MAQETNISNLVHAMARDLGDRDAVILPRGSARPSGPGVVGRITFAQLQSSIEDASRGLLRMGFQPGMRVVVMVRPGIEFLQVVFSLFRIGATVVAIDPGLGIRGVGACLEESRPDAFIGIPLAHMARILLGWGSKTIKRNVSTGYFPLLQSWSHLILKGKRGDEPALPQAKDPAAILFTSGSTGIAKGVVYEHEQFHAQVRGLQALYGIQPGEVDLPTFPLFGLFAPAMGMTAVIPEMDFSRPARTNPWNISGAVRAFQVTNLFASPALLRRLAELPGEINLPSICRVLSAGAPVPAREISSLVKRLSPGVQVFTPYGATEALPLASIGSAEILGETALSTSQGNGVCVGKPAPDATLRIIRIDDGPIPEWKDDLELPQGEVGEIVVGGPMVTRHYLHRPDQEARAKMISPDGTILHRMGDLGHLDAKGRLWFSGRKSQRVVNGNVIHHTIHCEGVFDSVEGVFRSALVGVGPPGRQEPVLCIQKAVNAPDEDRLRASILETAARFPHTRSIKTVLFHPNFPVDVRHNSKIRREELAIWAAGGQS